MPRCEECGKWFFTRRAMEAHFDSEHFFPRRNRVEDEDNNSVISAGIPIMAHPFYNSPSAYASPIDDEEDTVKGGGGDFGGVVLLHLGTQIRPVTQVHVIQEEAVTVVEVKNE